LTDAVTIVRCTLEVTTAGKLRLNLHDAGGIALWLDGTVREVHNVVALDLPRGMHTLTLRIDARQRANARLRCELADVPGSAAQARFVGGR
jgi:hypothetical protein